MKGKYGFAEWKEFTDRKTVCLEKYGKDYLSILGVFASLINEADHDPVEFDDYVLRTGEAVISVNDFSFRYRIRKTKLAHYIKVLKKEGLIEIEEISYKHKKIIIPEWEKFAGFYV